MDKTRRILVVDDEPALLRLYSQVLGAEGYEVYEAATARQGLEAARQHRPHLVLLDVMLPDLSGIELCRQLKAEPALPELFIALISGAAVDSPQRIAGLAAGAEDFISKLTPPSELVARIRMLARLRDTAAALRESVEQYRQLAENIREVFWMTDLTKKQMLYVSPAYEEIWGRSCVSLYASPRDWVEAIHPEDRERVLRAALTQQAAGGYNQEYRILRPDGTMRWVQDRAFPVRDESGAVYRLVGIAEDITSRKRAEEALQASEARARKAEAEARLLANAVESSQELICITDTENRFIFVNEAALGSYGYSREELLGKTPQMLQSPRNPPGSCEQVWQATLSGGWRGELLNLKKDGTEFPLSLSTSQIKDAAGQIVGLLGIGRDISDRKRAERQSMAFSELGHRFGAASTAQEAAAIILDVARNLFSWDAGYVHLYSQAEDSVTRLLTIDTVGGERRDVPCPTATGAPSPLMRKVMKEGALLLDGDMQQRGGIPLVPFGETNRPSASRMFVPLHGRGAVVGILSIQSYSAHAYSQGDLRLLETLANHCGDALQRIEVTEALRKAETKYRSIFENATEGIFQASPEGRLLAANPALARMFRYESPEDMARGVRHVAGQLNSPPARLVELKRALKEHGRVEAFEAEGRRNDGTLLWVSLNARAVQGAGGTLQHYEGTVQDISERKQAEQRLTEALGFNETILAASTVGIQAFRSSGECIFANAAAGRILGATPEALMAQNFRHLRSWKESGLLAMAERALHSQGPATAEVHKRTEFGKELWADCQMMAFDNLRERHLLFLQLDITPRKRLEQELRRLPQRILQAQELERQRVARDLHDSVNQLLASAQMRLRRVETALRPLRPSLAEILARSGTLLVQALEENRRIAHDLRPTELDELGFTVACRSFCKQFALRTGVATRCEITRLGRRLGPAMELHLFRIVQEAFQNAEKHARARTVHLRLVRQGSRLVLAIRDDGRGFDSGLGKSRRRSRRGMGLTNIRERAALMGGTCEIQSAPGEGTAVRVRVPLQKT